MKSIFFLLFFTYTSFIFSQTIELTVLNSDGLNLANVDVYFNNSKKSFVTDQLGNAIIDISEIDQTDFMIISKKDFEDMILNVTDLKPKMILKLNNVNEIELDEVNITNLRVTDIINNIILNYDNNFLIDKYFLSVNFQQEIVLDSLNRDFIDVDLQFLFKKNSLKIKSTGTVNDILKNNKAQDLNVRITQYLKSIYLKDIYIQPLYEDLINEKKTFNYHYTQTKYGNKNIYDIYIKGENQEYFILVDKNTFSIIEFTISSENRPERANSNNILRKGLVSYKFRPHNNYWILKESSAIWNTTYEENNIKTDVDIKFNISVKEYDIKPFNKFKKNVNEKMDIRKSF